MGCDKCNAKPKNSAFCSKCWKEPEKGMIFNGNISIYTSTWTITYNNIAEAVRSAINATTEFSNAYHSIGNSGGVVTYTATHTNNL